MVIGSEEVLAAELVPNTEERQISEIDLAKPVSLKQITKTATAKLETRDHMQGPGSERRKPAQDCTVAED